MLFELASLLSDILEGLQESLWAYPTHDCEHACEEG